MSNGTRVFVGGLSHRVRERDLERFFQKIGRVKDIAMKNGYAFVVSVQFYFQFIFSMGSGSRIYIGRLPFGVRERDIERFFRGFGRIREILLKNGYGFVVSKIDW